jgi:hypothetical protein
MSELVAYRDVAEHGLIEVADELERQVRDDLFHERCRVHCDPVANDPDSCRLRTTLTDLRMPVHATTTTALETANWDTYLAPTLTRG